MTIKTRAWQAVRRANLKLRKVHKAEGEQRVLNLNAIMVVSTITDEEMQQAYKDGRIAEMSLKQAGSQA